MNEIYGKAIKEQADEIRKRLANGTIYGIPINIYDSDMVLVAAVYMTRAEGERLFAERIERAFKGQEA